MGSLIKLQQDANEHLVLTLIRLQDDMRLLEEEAEALRASSQSRDLLMAIVGHDLKNPLSVIALAIQLIGHPGHLSENDERTIGRIRRSVDRMNRMISQLFSFTRAGLPLHYATVNLRDLCVSLGEEFGSSIQLLLEGNLVGTWDADQITAALTNIVGNDIQYAAEGTPIIVKILDQGQDILIEISNQGEPISAELLPVLFHAFRQGRANQSGHLGLGLYIAHEAIRLHGGTLAALSSHGTTTFTIHLPRSNK